MSPDRKLFAIILVGCAVIGATTGLAGFHNLIVVGLLCLAHGVCVFRVFNLGVEEGKGDATVGELRDER